MPSLINQQFIKAVQNNQIDELKNLLDRGADIHADNDEALRCSASNGHLETVKFLVAQGANIHANDDDALKNAASQNHNDVLQVLSAFIQEEKLLVAAVGSMPLIAASDSTSASSCLCGILVLPAVGSLALVAASDSMLQTQPQTITKAKRSKI